MTHLTSFALLGKDLTDLLQTEFPRSIPPPHDAQIPHNKTERIPTSLFDIRPLNYLIHGTKPLCLYSFFVLSL